MLGVRGVTSSLTLGVSFLILIKPHNEESTSPSPPLGLHFLEELSKTLSLEPEKGTSPTSWPFLGETFFSNRWSGIRVSINRWAPI